MQGIKILWCSEGREVKTASNMKIKEIKQKIAEENIKETIEHFLLTLKAVPSTQAWTNFYYGSEEAPLTRLNNLRHYFYLIARQQPKTMLLGETPSYYGYNSGIPFTNRSSLLQHPFFKESQCQALDLLPLQTKRKSTSQVWMLLEELEFYPLLWNIFPFHAHQAGAPFTNRTPKKKELLLGLPYTKELIKIFAIKKVICLGRKAESMAERLSLPYKYVRHPANGGATLFKEQLRALFLSPHQLDS